MIQVPSSRSAQPSMTSANASSNVTRSSRRFIARRIDEPHCGGAASGKTARGSGEHQGTVRADTGHGKIPHR